ncbi:uncharacterized protein LOC128678747 [Plodia interpunctella]|uniref:uncharacterized protein LOC128678747 n=1 Tax=Plodia interpunctella TaxID=58824 RepID=UPI002368E8F7|nr:uncharacterized protein LOC128678747 [Plodia interpunctella]
MQCSLFYLCTLISPVIFYLQTSSGECDARCSGQNCVAGLDSHKKCFANCTGFECSVGCLGPECIAYCEGQRCHSGCRGNNCKSFCKGLNCKVMCMGAPCLKQEIFW